MFAIVQIGNSQFRVSEGDTIDAQRIEAEEGKNLNLDQVLLFAKGSDIRVGQPYVKDVKVSAKVVQKSLGRKVIALKYRRRKNSATKKGHRSRLTSLNITKISAK